MRKWSEADGLGYFAGIHVSQKLLDGSSWVESGGKNMRVICQGDSDGHESKIIQCPTSGQPARGIDACECGHFPLRTAMGRGLHVSMAAVHSGKWPHPMHRAGLLRKTLTYRYTVRGSALREMNLDRWALNV